MPHNNEAFPGIGQAIILALVTFASQFLLGFAAFCAFSALHVENALVIRSTSLAAGSSAIVAAIYYGYRLNGLSFQRYAALRPFNPWVLAPILSGMFGLGLVASELSSLVGPLLPPGNLFLRAVARRYSSDVVNMITIAVVAPITEELMFRGMILGGILLRGTGRVTAIVITAIIFACFHMNPYQVVSALILGLALGLLFIRTQSVIPCIVAHSFFNLQKILLYKLHVLIPGYNTISASWEQSISLGVLGAVLLCAFFLLLGMTSIRWDGPPQ